MAYLFDSTLEAGLLVLHSVNLTEGASAQTGLVCDPVDLFSILIIHWFEFLGLERRGSVPKARTVRKALQLPALTRATGTEEPHPDILPALRWGCMEARPKGLRGISRQR